MKMLYFHMGVKNDIYIYIYIYIYILLRRYNTNTTSHVHINQSTLMDLINKKCL